MQFLLADLEMERYKRSQKQQFIKTSPPLERLEYLRSPFDNIVRIVSKNAKAQAYGTGCLIAENIVLTCLHILVYKEHGNTEKVFRSHEIKVYIGQSGPNKHYVPYQVCGLQYNKKYFDKDQQYNQVIYDYTLLLLDPEKKMSFDKGFLRLFQPLIKDKHIFELYGYDKDYNDRYNLQKGNQGQSYEYHLWGIQTDMWRTGGNGRIIEYKVSTDRGKSGAPLIAYSKQGRYVIIGIHCAKIQDIKQPSNYALKITLEMITQIIEWVRAWNEDSKNIVATYFEHYKHQEDQENRSIFKSNKPKQPLQKQKSTQEQVLISIGRIVKNFLQEHQGQDLFETDNRNYQLLQQDVFFTPPTQPRVQQTSPSSTSRRLSPSLANPPRNSTNSPNSSINKEQPDRICSQQQLRGYCAENLHLVKKLCLEKRVFSFSLVTGMKNLQILTLVSCNLREVPCLDILTSLRNVDCSNNQIVDATNFFTPWVVNLTLDFNLIEAIPGDVAIATSLKCLSLKQNKELRYIDMRILQIKKTLKQLKLNGCKLMLSENTTLNNISDEIYVFQGPDD